LQGFGQPVQNVQQDDRIHAAGDGDDDGISPTDPELPEAGLYVVRQSVSIGVGARHEKGGLAGMRIA
jgi:hypothetical protein